MHLLNYLFPFTQKEIRPDDAAALVDAVVALATALGQRARLGRGDARVLSGSSTLYRQ